MKNQCKTIHYIINTWNMSKLRHMALDVTPNITSTGTQNQIDFGRQYAARFNIGPYLVIRQS